MKKELNPGLLEPQDFWKEYFRHNVSTTPHHQLSNASRGLLALHEVFGNLIHNCHARITENTAVIEFSGCNYCHIETADACDAHLGAIQGVFEMTPPGRYKIKKNCSGSICRIVLEAKDGD